MLLSMFGLSLAGAEAIGWFVQALSPVLFFLLQIISQKDEHCWVGELNGLRGR